MQSQSHTHTTILSRLIVAAFERLETLRQVHAEMLDTRRYQEAEALQAAIFLLEGEIKADFSYLVAPHEG